MDRIRGRCVAVLAVLLALVTACTTAPAASRDADAAPSTSAELPGHVDTGSLPTPLPPPTSDAESDSSAVAQATAAVTAFARPALDAETWWAELTPLLSPAALEAYAGTDPAEVPASEVTGEGWPGESASDYLATVFVPTDAGEYAVLLVREGGGAPWLVERISQVQTGTAEGEQIASAEPGS